MQRESSSGLRSKLLKYLARKKKQSNKLLLEYVEKLKQKVPKSIILLFGSRARGEYLPYSDYDVAVILEDSDNKLYVTEKLRRLKPKGLDLDLIVLSIDELNDKLVKEMLRNSIILYKGIEIEISF